MGNDANEEEHESTYLCHSFASKCEVEGLEVAWGVDFDLLISVLIFLLQSSSQPTHRRLLAMHEYLREN